jgi:hypothetical protein
LTSFEIRSAPSVDGPFYSIGVHADDREALAQNTESLLAALFGMLRPYRFPMVLGCWCEPKILWSHYANLDCEQIARHLCDDLGEDHVVSVTPHLYLKAVEV